MNKRVLNDKRIIRVNIRSVMGLISDHFENT